MRSGVNDLGLHPFLPFWISAMAESTYGAYYATIYVLSISMQTDLKFLSTDYEMFLFSRMIIWQIKRT
jgi:hypothetical protein